MSGSDGERQKCYISAPFGRNLKVIKKILYNNNISSTDQSNIRIDKPIINTIEELITDANFVCGVIPTKKDCENVYFEVGIAYTKKKPIVLIADINIDLPVSLNNLMLIRVNFRSEESIKLALESFIKYGLKNYDINKTNIKNNVHNYHISNLENDICEIIDYNIYEPVISHTNGYEVQDYLTQLLSKHGYLVEHQLKINQNDQIFRPDIALWIDEIQNIFSNPVLIEIKLHNNNLQQAEEQLRRYLKAIGSNLGIIVYVGDRINGNNIVSYKSQFIVKFELYEFINLVKNNDLNNKLIQLRNQIVHGGL